MSKHPGNSMKHGPEGRSNMTNQINKQSLNMTMSTLWGLDVGLRGKYHRKNKTNRERSRGKVKCERELAILLDNQMPEESSLVGKKRSGEGGSTSP